MQSAELYVQNQLEQVFGMNCQRVRESVEKTADLTAISASGEHFVVEVKTLHPRARRQPDRSGFFGYEDQWFKRSSSGSAIKKAAKQIRKTSAAQSEEPIGLLWIMSVPDDDADFRLDQSLGELLGFRGVVCTWQGEENAVHIRCIDAKPSRFERHPEIAGAIVAYPEPEAGLQLFINHHSAKAELLRKSSLAEYFRGGNAVIDPALITSGTQGYLVCDTEVDRRDDRAIASYLKRKFSLNVAHMCDMRRFTSAVLVQPHTGVTGARPTE